MQASAAQQEVPAAAAGAPPLPPAPAGTLPTPAAAPQAGGVPFVPSAAFAGARPGYAFQAGLAGIGYYLEGTPQHGGPDAAQKRGAAASPGAGAPPGPPGGGGWAPMRTVAELRREAGVGAPRNADSLYRPIERAPRRFNPLKIPRALQACFLSCGLPPRIA